MCAAPPPEKKVEKRGRESFSTAVLGNAGRYTKKGTFYFSAIGPGLHIDMATIRVSVKSRMR